MVLILVVNSKVTDNGCVAVWSLLRLCFLVALHTKRWRESIQPNLSPLDHQQTSAKIEPMTNKETTNTNNEKFDGKMTRGKNSYRSSEFDSDFIKLYTENPFLGLVSQNIAKLADENVPTAYMGAKLFDKEYELVLGYNPNFFRSLTSLERQAVIIHELYHMIFRHITLRTMADPNLNQLWNIATDLAINSIIKDNLPAGCLIPGTRPQKKDKETGLMVDSGDKDLCDFIENAPPLETADYYMNSMREIIDEREDDESSDEDDPTGGLFTLDDHSGWGELPPEVEEALNEKMRDVLDKAVRDANTTSKHWGNIPQTIQDRLRAMLSREIDWRSIIKNFIGRCRSQDRTTSMKKINKFMPFVFPGSRRKTYANFACFIDQSGSMTDEDISMLFTELEGLAMETTIDVFHFDTEIDLNSKTTWKKKQPYPPHRTRCGGTDFSAVSSFCNQSENKGKWSGVIILTDGYAPVMPAITNTKVLWVITPTGTTEITRPGDLITHMKKSKGKFRNV